MPGEIVDVRNDSSPRAEQNLIGDQQASNDVGVPQDAHGSAQAAKADRATKVLLDGVDAEFGFLSSCEVGQRLGARVEDAEDIARRTHEDGSLLAIRQNSQDRFPAFQFQPDGVPRPVIRALREMCVRFRWSESDLFLWLVVTTTRFDGARPVDLLLAKDAAAEERLLKAAEMEMATEW